MSGIRKAVPENRSFVSAASLKHRLAGYLNSLGSADMTILHAFTNQYQFQRRFQFKPVGVQRKVGASAEADTDIAKTRMRDDARRVARNIAKLPALLPKPS